MSLSSGKAMIRLQEMTAAEFAAFVERETPSYAAENVRLGLWSTAEALERARSEFAKLLPKGLATPDHYLRTIVTQDRGERVGEVWYCRRTDESGPHLWIYWIGVEPAYRRRGYGLATLRELEHEARRLGLGRIALHVFGDNTGAQAAYTRAGYLPRNIIMVRQVPER